jgi:hypothetical protein
MDDELLTGKEGIEAAAGYEPMPEPTVAPEAGKRTRLPRKIIQIKNLPTK